MDIRLQGENGLELTKKIKARYSEIVVVILTSYDLPEYRQASEVCGASQFFSKDSSSREEILAVVESIVSQMGVGSNPKEISSSQHSAFNHFFALAPLPES